MRKTLKHKWLLLMLMATTALLAACGGHSSYQDNASNNGSGNGTGAMFDTYTKYVSDAVASVFDDREPIAITDVALTTPDNTEPEVVK
ncbi:MAG: hypothetical protein V4447_01850 [Pseudomonadota bacterium]